MASSAEEGRIAYRAGRFDEAARHLTRALEEAPQDSALRLMLARSLEQGGHGAAAREHLRHVATHAASPEHQKLAAEALAELDNPSDELTHRLVRAGLMTDDELRRAIEARRPDETPLSAVLRTTGVRFSDLVTVRFGAKGLAPSFERPFADRLGMRLVAAKAITQFQLKQALMAQAHAQRPLGRIMAESQGVSEAALKEAAQSHGPPAPKLTESDSLGATLVRWGLITPQQWQSVLLAKRSPAETLVAQHLCNREHLMRVQAYQKAKLAALAERRHRLGEVLVGLGSLEGETLAKMLACQVDQPFMFGELLVMQRACSPEAVLEGLAEQQRLYRVDAEEFLPPLEPMQPPEPPKELEAPATRPDRRRVWAIALGVAALLGYAAWYGLRYGGNDYGWLAMFRQPPSREQRDAKGRIGELKGGSQQGAGPRDPGSRFDPLEIPENGRQGARMEAPPATRYDPFAQDGAPTTPNLNAPMAELSPGVPSDAELQAEASFGDPTVRGNATYPMQGRAEFGGERYAMGTADAPRAQGDPMRRPEGPQARTGPEGPSAERLSPQGVRYGMRGAEGARDVTPPAKVLGTPIARVGNQTLEAQQALDEETVSQSSSIFRFRLGQAFFAQGKLESARQEFMAARAADPKNPLPLYYLGRLSEQRGARASARTYYRQYLDEAPGGEFSGEASARMRLLGN